MKFTKYSARMMMMTKRLKIDWNEKTVVFFLFLFFGNLILSSEKKNLKRFRQKKEIPQNSWHSQQRLTNETTVKFI